MTAESPFYQALAYAAIVAVGLGLLACLIDWIMGYVNERRGRNSYLRKDR